MGSHRVGHDWAIFTFTLWFSLWKKFITTDSIFLIDLSLYRVFHFSWMSFGSCYLLVRVSILSNNSLNWYQISIFGHHFRCSSIVLIFLKDSASYLIGFHYFLYVLLFSALLLISDYNYGLTYFSSSSINFCLMCVDIALLDA